MSQRIGVLGVGAIGAAMARNLLEADFDVRVRNRTAEKAEALADADVVLTALFDAGALRKVMGGAAEALRPGSVWAAQHGRRGRRGRSGRGARPLAEQGVVSFGD